MKKQDQLTLDKTNYHSNNANLKYMSVSQFKSFVECEAKTMARLKGDYSESPSNALIVGSYVHAAFESEEAFNECIAENRDSIFKSRGGKYSDFEIADRMIEAIKQDPFAMFSLEGDKEEIYTAEIYGVEWKIRVDSINHDRKTFTDIKTTQDLHKRYWSVKYNRWVSFVEAWDYVLQMAVYRKILKETLNDWYTPYILAVTKENPPNKRLLHFDETRFDFEYEYIESKIERFLEVKHLDAKPIRCGKCDYCRATNLLQETMEIESLLYE